MYCPSQIKGRSTLYRTSRPTQGSWTAGASPVRPRARPLPDGAWQEAAVGVLAAGGDGRGLLHQEGPSEHPWVLGDPPTWQRWPCPWHLGWRLPPPRLPHTSSDLTTGYTTCPSMPGTVLVLKWNVLCSGNTFCAGQGRGKAAHHGSLASDPKMSSRGWPHRRGTCCKSEEGGINVKALREPRHREGETRALTLAMAPMLRGPGRGTLHGEPHLITFPADDELKLGRYQRVQADVDGAETSFLKLR